MDPTSSMGEWRVHWGRKTLMVAIFGDCLLDHPFTAVF